ncbi:ABC transporter ATP-binding protein [Brucella sp. ZJ1_1]|nr:ABC transporter ATP-binding protein [Brucella intermedia]KAB2718815.1 ABC transporter ATP-binding protein [Brucella intermedia]MCB4917425.1 ABC transporter ATP-binding protein/permease [Brucella intermedia]OOC64591.1 multidrug ABC transporter ATP-binding protein [Brucella intermedia M86]SUB13248.1 Putative multidrug export ATP-binding/permease protein SAV1866 [Brucella intermedia]
MKAVYSLFERWVDPFREPDRLRPPSTTLGFLWHYARQAKWPLAASLVVGGLLPLVEAGLFYFTGRLVDILDQAGKGGVERSWSALLQVAGPDLLFMGVTVLVIRLVVTAINTLLEEQVMGPNFYNLIRWQANSYVLQQSYGFFQNDFAGRIATKVWQAGQAAGDFIQSLIQVVWFMLIYSISTLFLIGRLDWTLAAVVLAWIAVFVLIARHYLPQIRRQAEASAEAGSLINGRLVDSYSNIQTIKLNTVNDDVQYLREGFKGYIAALLPFMRSLTGVRVSLTALSGLMIVTVAAIAIDLWTRNAITVGQVSFTLGLVLRLNMLLGRLMMQLNGMLRQLGLIENSMRLVSAPLGLEDRPDARPLQVTEARIDVRNVTFHYGKAAGVLDNINLTVRGGERVGLVGHSGAGKSTLVNLILRLYDVEKGSILVDGQDVRDVTQTSLRRAVAVVSQETALLHRSLRDNIMLARDDATDEELLQAARQAEADGFIANLEDFQGRRSFDAFVGERGVKLSGGQRQRIAIARAILKDAPILILDEATSALDSEVEASIQENLKRLMEGKTVIAIAHRLSTIAALDRLVVMDQGRIVEEGTHDELIARGGIYAGLWARQSGGFIGRNRES